MNHFLLYAFSVVLIFSALKTVTSKNLANGALYLAVSMVSLSGIFFLLGFVFIAGLQLIVYAGAVIVIFVMVLMLFDLKEEVDVKIDKKNLLQWGLPLFTFGLVSGVLALMAFSHPVKEAGLDASLKEMALQIFIKYVLIFEILGLLLLIVAMGVVTLSRLDKE
ncbi:MAG: NADH-quinone oxidoreductase subunit J family protein [Bdellovibrionales bacterium]